eukprot:NODE_890_length_3403_cov_0.243039.p2 type:complete len:243 gc:universal NODE_890_length_3403_cov_0.243039:790-62(-)
MFFYRVEEKIQSGFNKEDFIISRAPWTCPTNTSRMSTKVEFNDASQFKKACFETTIPNIEKPFLRHLGRLDKEALIQLRDVDCVFVDPGKKFIYSTESVSFSCKQYKHLMFTNAYQKELKRGKEKHGILKIEDLLSKTRTFLDYLDALAPYMKQMNWFYSQKCFKEWRFRRFGLKQKIKYMMYNELVTGEKTLTNFKLSDKERKKQKIKKGTLKRAICWGSGGKAHVKGCDPVPNRLLCQQF